MGLNPNALRFLAREFKNGNRFTRTAMIGRQGVHVTATQLEQILNVEFKLNLPSHKVHQAHSASYADELFRLLGASIVHSFDYSNYEGATYIHDFNEPIPTKYKAHYSFVVDGGTLEHVFQFPTALKNCMELLEIGGVYFGVTPANNEMGHGFYQFSPELYFRAFSAQNGFHVDGIWLYEGRESPVWLKVSDPDTIHRRAEKVNSRSTYMLVRATKIAQTQIFSQPPLQSDYVAAWSDVKKIRCYKNENAKLFGIAVSLWRHVGRLVPFSLKRSIVVSAVWIREKLKRTKIILGIDIDKVIYQKFDPTSD